MCGICGRHNFGSNRPVTDRELGRMCRAMAHRGPDDEGTFFDPGAGFGFGMRRLSIIDLEGGRQPMASEDGDLVVVFNGEIYNFRQLRTELESAGHSFATRSDTETILHLYEDLGPDCVHRLNGMFAVAVWNRRDRSLFLARDRVGIKPLYYYEGRGFLAFASEIKCLLELEDIPREVDEDALELYLTLQYAPAPMTMFRGLRQLMPGQRMLVRDGKIGLDTYWDLPRGPARAETGTEADELIERLDAAVLRRLVADVPLGAFLSGGLDSSVIVALMARRASGPVSTFSIGFDEEGFDETPFSSTVAGLLGTDHEIEILRPELEELLPLVVRHMDQPMADPAAVPMYLLSRMARRKVKVVLTGEGADELFGGYEKYRIVDIVRNHPMLGLLFRAGPVRRLAEACLREKKHRAAVRCLASPEPVTFAGWTNYLDRAERAELLGRGIEPPESFETLYSRLLDRAGLDDDLRALMYMDFKYWLPDDILAKVDKMSMAHGLEARVPFLDHTLAEWAFQLPSRLKIRGRVLKHILKQAAGDLLPPEIVHRKKHGFDLPVARWLRHGLAGYAGSALAPDRLARHGLIRPEPVARLLAEHASGRHDHGRKLWILLNFQIWHETFF